MIIYVSVAQDSWYYHLCASQSGEMDLQLTNTEKLISKIEKSANPLEHKLWMHPVLNFTTGPLQRTLTSLPSAMLNEEAKKLFQSVQSFICTQLVLPRDTGHHISLAQDIIGTCLKHSPLQDEVYCQVLRQISGHQSPLSIQVSHVSVGVWEMVREAGESEGEN